jgi:hypothetical protein
MTSPALAPTPNAGDHHRPQEEPEADASRLGGEFEKNLMGVVGVCPQVFQDGEREPARLGEWKENLKTSPPFSEPRRVAPEVDGRRPNEKALVPGGVQVISVSVGSLVCANTPTSLGSTVLTLVT